MSTVDLLLDLDAATWLAVAAGVVLVVVGTLVRSRRTPSRRRGGRLATRRNPQVGDVWWADVPFEEGGGSKDRPCVVVATHGLRVQVLYVTSRDKSGRPGWQPIPRTGWSRQPGHSWVRTDRRVAMDSSQLRRYAGPCPASLRPSLGV